MKACLACMTATFSDSPIRVRRATSTSEDHTHTYTILGINKGALCYTNTPLEACGPPLFLYCCSKEPKARSTYGPRMCSLKFWSTVGASRARPGYTACRNHSNDAHVCSPKHVIQGEYSFARGAQLAYTNGRRGCEMRWMAHIRVSIHL